MNKQIERLDPRLLLTTTLSREASFSGDGIVKLDYGPTTVIRDAYAKSDNMVVVGGGLNDNLLVVRLRSNGKQDLSFGDNGFFRMDLNDQADSVVSIEPSGSGWLLTTAQDKLVRINAKGKFDRTFGVRPLLGESDVLAMGFGSAWKVGAQGDQQFFVGLSPAGRFELVRATKGVFDTTTTLAALPLRDGPTGFDDWTPEHNWTTPHFFLTADGKVAVLAAETEPWLSGVSEYGVAKAYLWNPDGSLDTATVVPSLAGFNGALGGVHQRSDGSVVFLQRAALDNHTRLGVFSADLQTFRNLGPLGISDGPHQQSVYYSIELVDDNRVIARGFENPRLAANGGASSMAIVDLVSGSQQVLREGIEDRLISARTTPWNSEAVVYSKGRVALFTAAYVNGTNQIVSGTSGNDFIQINQNATTLTVNVNGTSREIPMTTYDAFENVNGTGSTLRLNLQINALGGKDKIVLNGSVPVSVNAGSGRDTVYTGPGDDTIEGGTGDDLVFAGDGTDLVRGGSGYDNLFGGPGADTLWGGTNNDYLDGQEGPDSLFGESGNDTLVEYATGSVDLLHGGSGTDRGYHPESQDILESIEGVFVPPSSNG